MTNDTKNLPARVDELDLAQLGTVLAQCGYFKDIKDKAQAIVKILVGRELGIAPIAAVMGIHVIDGKPSIGAHLIALGVKRSKRYDYRVADKTEERCSIEFFEKLPDGQKEKLGVETFTLDDAKRAGLAGRGGWKAHPKAMLFARAIGQGYRTHCPDAFDIPVYAEGEIEQVDAPQARPPKDETIDAPFEVTPPRPSTPASPGGSPSAGPATTPPAGPAAGAGPDRPSPAPSAPPSGPSTGSTAAPDRPAVDAAKVDALVGRIKALRQQAPAEWHDEIDLAVKGALKSDDQVAALTEAGKNLRQSIDAEAATKAAAPTPATGSPPSGPTPSSGSSSNASSSAPTAAPSPPPTGPAGSPAPTPPSPAQPAPGSAGAGGERRGPPPRAGGPSFGPPKGGAR